MTKCELCGFPGADVEYDKQMGMTVCKSPTACSQRQRRRKRDY